MKGKNWLKADIALAMEAKCVKSVFVAADFADHPFTMSTSVQRVARASREPFEMSGRSLDPLHLRG